MSRSQLYSASRAQALSQQLKSTSHSSGLVLMPIILMRSEYTGPIGIGTRLDKPCMEAASLAEGASLIEGAVASASAAAVSRCYTGSESLLNVVFDTGSTNIWIASDLCKLGSCVKKGRRRFNHTESATFSFPPKRSRLHVKFGTGKLSGPLGIDDLRIGPVSVRQTFAMMEEQVGAIWEKIPLEGIVGLGFPALATKSAAPFFDSMIDQKALAHNEFAFYLSRDNPAANALLWGGVDPAFYQGEIEYFPVVDPYYWSLELHAFKIGDESMLGDSRKDHSVALLQTHQSSSFKAKKVNRHRAVLDSGTTYLSAPAEIFDDVVQRLPRVACAKMTEKSHPPITYTMRNSIGHVRDFVMTNNEYMTAHGKKCTPGFMKLNLPEAHGPGMILGDAFLRVFFSVYDRGDGQVQGARIGLARAARTNDVQTRLRHMTSEQTPSLLQKDDQSRHWEFARARPGLPKATELHTPRQFT